MSILSGKDFVATAFHKEGVVSFLRGNAYVNLSDVAKPFNKRMSDWMRLKQTKALIERFECDPSYNGNPAIYTKEGKGGGTFACKEIADAFEEWCKKDPNELPSRVYFIRGDKTNSFKIGVSSNPRKRLKNMQIGSPVKLLLTRDVEVFSPHRVEQELHDVFSNHKIHGEWFSMTWKEAVEIFDRIVKEFITQI